MPQSCDVKIYRFDMKLLAKVTGAWKTARRVFIKQAGTWKPVRRVFVKVAGVWKKVYSSGGMGVVTAFASSPNATYPEGFQGVIANIDPPIPDPSTGSTIYYMLRNTQSAGTGGDGLQVVSSWGHQVTVNSPTYFGPLRVTNLTTGVSLVLLNPGGGNPTWYLAVQAPDYANNPHQQNPYRNWLRPNTSDTFLFERA